MKASVIFNIKTINQHCGLISVSIPIFIFLLGCFCTSIVSVNNVSALTYQDNVGLNFTFNPSITVSLSNASGSGSADLVINDLTPGTSSDSNIIIVNVLTNNTNGYELKSNVGNSTTYASANRDLVLSSALPNNVTSTTPKFSSIDYGASESSLTVDNTWGYSYLDETLTGSTWSNYSGLPLYSDTEHTTTLKTANGPSLSTGDNIDFKIAAKASTTQASGEYNNVINFIAVGNTNPTSFYDAFSAAGKQMYNGYYKMQDMTTSICNSVYTSQLQDNTDTMEAQLIDIRDNNVYWVAKLKDGHCWMTQNLDLNLDSSVALTSNDTDLTDHSLTGAYADGYTYDSTTGVTTWTPVRSTIDAVTDESTSISTIPDWPFGTFDSPLSINTGDWYWLGTYYDSSSNCPADSSNMYLGCDYISKATYGTNAWATYFSTKPFAANGTHGHVGNYYNWSASVASNDSSTYNYSTYSNPAASPQNSICPSNWRTPIIATYNKGQLGDNEFYNLDYHYNSGQTSTDYGLIMSPIYFTRAGYMYSERLHTAGSHGYYRSNTVESSFNARHIFFASSSFNPSNSDARQNAGNLRCLAR